MSTAAIATEQPIDRKRTLLGGAIGHFIEWYDWSIYGFLAGIFAAQMFPAEDATASLIASFLAFALGFVGRPIGAFVLSPLADKYGRRALLSLTIILVALVAHRALPFKIPGALAAVLVGVFVYWVGNYLGKTFGIAWFRPPKLTNPLHGERRCCFPVLRWIFHGGRGFSCKPWATCR